MHIIKRMVMKRCIYGVDLNEMAVELAKVSLWLHSFTVGAPLSFLDHHLKCGNSLIGVFDVSGVIIEATERYREIVRALHNMVLIGQLTDATIADTQESARLFGEARGWLEPFRRRLDVSLAMEHFMELNKNERVALQSAIAQEQPMPPKIESLREQALTIAREKRFFHWKLEFPEVWYAENKSRANPGFDAVVGNPPWVGHVISELEPVIGGSVFASTDKVDTYLSFLDKGLVLAKVEGLAGFITPNTYFNNRSALPLRRELAERRQLALVIDLPKQTFPDAPDVYPCISILRKADSKQNNYFVGRGTTSTIHPSLSPVLCEHLQPPRYYILVARPDIGAEKLFSRLESSFQTLDGYATFQKGVETGNDTKHLRLLTKTERGWYRWLHGREIERFGINSDGWHVNYGPHLKNAQTPDLRTTPKILIQYIRKLTLYPRIVAAFDKGEFFPSYGTLVSLIPKETVQWGFLLTLLSSSLINRFYQHRFHDIAVKSEYLYKLPIRRIFFTTPAPERQAQVEALKKLYHEAMENLTRSINL
jgi:hypothetical protein